MKLYLDSADARQWPVLAGCPLVQGVTSNFTRVMQAGLPVSLPGFCSWWRRRPWRSSIVMC